MESQISDPYISYQQQRHFGSLDGVRCLAILAVVWHHSQETSLALLSRGFLGVDLFFVLSGFLIVTLLLRERDHKGVISLRDFYMRRSLRIFPVYYGLLAALGLLYLIKPTLAGGDSFFRDLPYYATYTSNWIKTDTPNMDMVWSLAAEEQFYLVWPAIERFLPTQATLTLLGGGLILNQAVNYGLLDDTWRSWTGTEPNLHILDATFTPILLGVLLAHLLHRRWGFGWFCRIAGAQWSSLAWGLGLLVAIAISQGDISGTPRLVIQVLMMVWLGSLVIREDHLLSRPLGWAPIARLGAISYGMYLFHMFAIHIGREGLERLPAIAFPGALFVLGLLVTILIAEVSFRLYETPFLRLKHRFAWRGKPDSETA
ncbi:MAG: acyltransferase [Phycisphaeraceae bacterium]